MLLGIVANRAVLFLEPGPDNGQSAMEPDVIHIIFAVQDVCIAGFPRARLSCPRDSIRTG